MAYKVLITNIGQQKFTNAEVNNTKVNFAYIAIGDGNGQPITPDPSMTSLVNEKYRTTVNQVHIDPDNPSTIVVEGVIPLSVGGFYIREIGIFDTDGDLILIANYPESYKPDPATEGAGFELPIEIRKTLSNVATVNITVDNTVILAKKQDIIDAIDTHNVDATAHQDIRQEIQNVRQETDIKISQTKPISKPSIVSPTDGTTNFWSNIQSSQFQANNFSGIHEATDWEIATDITFTSIIESAYDDRVNLTSYLPKNLQPNTTYYVRVRYKSDNHVSDWSEPVSFTTGANRPPKILNVNWSSDVFYDNSSYTVEIVALDDGDTLTYNVTCNDPNVTITQDTTNPNVFTVTFPDYTEDVVVDFTYTVSDGTVSTSLTESKTVYDYVPFVANISLTATTDTYENNSFIDSNSQNIYSIHRNRIIKLDKNGNYLQSYYISNYSTDFMKFINGSIFIGELFNLIKLDKDFNFLYSRQINNAKHGFDGKYLFSVAVDANVIRLVKYDENLNIIFSKEISTMLSNFSLRTVYGKNEVIYILGYDSAVPDVLHLIKVNSDFTYISRSYQISGADTSRSVLKVDSNNNILISFGISGTDRKAAIAKFDTELWYMKGIYISTTTSNDYLKGISITSNDEILASHIDVYGNVTIFKIDNSLTNISRAIQISMQTNSSSNNTITGNFEDGIFAGCVTANNYIFVAKFDIDKIAIGGSQIASTNVDTYTFAEITPPTVGNISSASVTYKGTNVLNILDSNFEPIKNYASIGYIVDDTSIFSKGNIG